MSGHAILDCCHNCGAKDVELKVVHQSETSSSCGDLRMTDEGPRSYHHIHVTAACPRCVEMIWERP
jgi:hypothetical protein